MQKYLVSMLFITGCATAPGPSSSSEVALRTGAVVSSPMLGAGPAHGVCPVLWTCDHHAYFAAQGRCHAFCGSDPCFQEETCQ